MYIVITNTARINTKRDNSTHFTAKGATVYRSYLLCIGQRAFHHNYMPFIAQTWSIGIEEQFYYVWPWIVKKSTNYLKVLMTILIGLLLITNVLYY